jgi:hypothetical protein
MARVDLHSICAHVTRLSAKHEVDALAVVGLLAVHALVDVNFAQLRVWKNVAGELRQGYAH